MTTEDDDGPDFVFGDRHWDTGVVVPVVRVCSWDPVQLGGRRWWILVSCVRSPVDRVKVVGVTGPFGTFPDP